jgi:hypothetical protein
MGLMARHTAGQGAALKVGVILEHGGMTAQAILELEEWLGVGLMAIDTGEGHGCPLGERLPLHLHGRMAGQAGLPLRQNLCCRLREEVVAGHAVETRHATDIRAGGGVARLTGLYPGLDGMQRGQVTAQTFQVGSHHMDLVTRRFRNLGQRRSWLMWQSSHTLRASWVWGDVLIFPCCPMPHDPGTIAKALLMDMYGSLPGYGSPPARSAKPSP